MSGFSRALRILDEVQHLAQLEAFEPTLFVAAISDAAPQSRPNLADVGCELDGVRGLLGEIDRFTQKTMRIRLNHLTDALPQKLRILLYSTIVAYERDPALLRGRVMSMLGRLDRSTALALTDQVCDAAERVLAVRPTLRQGVIELVQRIATAQLPATRRAARDRSQAKDEREGWGRARVDLEQIAARGETIETGSFAERLKKIAPPTEDSGEPEPDPTATRFSLLELD
jgi:hypothetical protein